MSRRQISWSAVRRDMQADRQQFPAGFLGTRSLVEVYARTTNKPLVVAGKYDRAAIMTHARRAADAHQERFGCSRAEAMSVALKAAWQLAKNARSRSAH